MEPEIVGKRVAQLMNKNNIKKEELAVKMGVNLENLNNKLEGKEEFYLNEIIKLKNIFNLDVKECDEIFFQESDESDNIA